MFNQKRTCFIITPIGDESDPIRRHIEGIIDTVIEPVLGNDYKINVAHRLFEVGSINKQIITLIYESDLVIANLTERNPNVMYELAFRHTLGKPAIMMAEKDTKLPFDVLAERTIFYKNDIQGASEAKAELKKYVQQIDYDNIQTVGPIHDYLDSVELNNLIYGNNQKKNTNEILNLMAKRLEGIENTIQKLEKDSTIDFSDNVFGNIYDFKIAKTNTTLFLMDSKINLIKQITDFETHRLEKNLTEFSDFIKKCSSEGKNIDASNYILKLSEFKDMIYEYKNEIDEIIDSE